MPTVSDVSVFVKEFAPTVASIDGVKSVFVWGAYAQNHKEASKIIKEIDIIAMSSFFSEDLISITDGSQSPLKMKTASLEEEGFDPAAIDFTKKFIEPQKFNIKHWAISSDKKLLHWGPIMDTPEDWADLKREAEEYANFVSECHKDKLEKASQKIKEKWSMMYDHHVNKFLIDMPKGWYQTEHKIKDVLTESIKII